MATSGPDLTSSSRRAGVTRHRTRGRTVRRGLCVDVVEPVEDLLNPTEPVSRHDRLAHDAETLLEEVRGGAVGAEFRGAGHMGEHEALAARGDGSHNRSGRAEIDDGLEILEVLVDAYGIQVQTGCTRANTL